jgi:hypothetical protein|tara:strand:+ start:462 stop:602 length:141 start_codon:yes stop_codon:yes gene_type:complete
MNTITQRILNLISEGKKIAARKLADEYLAATKKTPLNSTINQTLNN